MACLSTHSNFLEKNSGKDSLGCFLKCEGLIGHSIFLFIKRSLLCCVCLLCFDIDNAEYLRREKIKKFKTWFIFSQILNLNLLWIFFRKMRFRVPNPGGNL